MADTTFALSVQNKFSTTLSTTVSSTDTVFVLGTLPTGTQGFLTIDEGLSSEEIIFYTSKGANFVQCTSVAQGRGQDGTSAVGHTSGAVVKQKTNAGFWKALQDGTGLNIGAIGASAYNNGWVPGLAVPNTITALGNRSYSVVVNSTDITGIVSPGMRLRTTRTVAAPTQCTSLNGTTQYYSKTTPAGMTFTNNFVVSAWVKLTSYANGMVASRYNGTSGWSLQINAAGQLVINGFNGGASNTKNATSYQSVPLNKWVHVAALLDMTVAGGAAVNTLYIDGVSVPGIQNTAGTNPTALIQAGNLEIGSWNGGLLPFPGKIAQVAIYSAAVTQATILASMHQTLVGTETSLISAYSFNGVITDLNANANNLTANGSAVATNADSPYGGQAGGTISSTIDYGIITATAFSTNTTLTVQVPEGCTIPTSGGVSAVSYSTQKVPYGLPTQKDKWRVISVHKTADATTSNATYGAFQSGGWAITTPIGEWEMGWRSGYTYSNLASEVAFNLSSTALTGKTVAQGATSSPFGLVIYGAAAAAFVTPGNVSQPQSLAAQTTYVMYTFGATTGAGIDGTKAFAEIFAECAYV